MTSDEILKAAFEQTMDEHFSQYDLEENEKPHRFSIAFYIRKISVVRLAKKAEKTGNPISLPQRKYIPLRRLAVIIALIGVIAVLTAAMWFTDIFVPGFVFDVYGDHSDVSVDFSMYKIKDTIEEVYWLPPESGCEFIDEESASDVVLTGYNFKDTQISLGQFAGSEPIGLNTENAEVYEINVGENPGFICIRQREGLENATNITWLYDGYVFHITAVAFTEEELLELAKSVSLKETENS